MGNISRHPIPTAGRGGDVDMEQIAAKRPMIFVVQTKQAVIVLGNRREWNSPIDQQEHCNRSMEHLSAIAADAKC